MIPKEPTVTTPDPEVREAAAIALAATWWLSWNDLDDIARGQWLIRADAVLAAVEPVIRRQERAEVAEEIARSLALVAESFRRDGLRAETYEQAAYTGHMRGALDEAAAIARSHSTREEQDHG